jgi:uncharacterized repeat protein (TIGR01451 family)
MRTIHMRAAFASLAIAALFALGAGRASAQGPTPEGTVISNEATASFTDANGNTYTDVTASVDVTVGFLAGPTVSAAGTTNPASPSAGSTVTFTITNNGNGIDQFTVAASADAGLTIDHYSYDGIDYATFALLNAVLQVEDVAAGAAIDIDVVYDVAAGEGGNPLDIDLTATSERDNGSSDIGTITITPVVAYTVTVTADAASVDNLPSNGGNETITFDVENTGTLADTYDLAASLGGVGNLVIVSVNGTGGANSTVALAAGASASISVVYTVNDVPAGTSDAITLTATSQADPGNSSDSDVTTVNVERPVLAMVKRAYRDDQTTEITGVDEVLPGEFIQYRIDLTNNGGANAISVEVTDPLAPSLIFDSTEGDVPADWTIGEAAGVVTATLDVALAPGATRTFWIRVQVE